MSDSGFSYSIDEIKQMSEDVLKVAKRMGASAAEAELSLSIGQNVSVRLGEVENIEYNRDKGMSVTVYFGQQKGHASTSDLSPKALEDTVAAACNIAKYTAQDPFCGLADAELMAKDIPDLDLNHPWNIAVDAAIELAKTCEQAALDVDKRISNSEGASVSNGHGFFHTAIAMDSPEAMPAPDTASAARSLQSRIRTCSAIIGTAPHAMLPTCCLQSILAKLPERVLYAD